MQTVAAFDIYQVSIQNSNILERSRETTYTHGKSFVLGPIQRILAIDSLLIYFTYAPLDYYHKLYRQ